VRVVLIAALTADGFIARTANHQADWTSKDDKRHFAEVTKRLGVMVMGSTTFDTIGRALPGRRTIVLSSRPEVYRDLGVEVFSGTPGELVARLETEGVENVAVVGGAHVYGQFLAGNLVDSLEITIEPLVFGTGIGLADTMLDLKLHLTSCERLGERAVLLTYDVDR
jgi:dihydrofolate reductase